MSEVYNGCDTTEYIQVPGPRGEQGQRGPQGERGVQGPQGPQGVDGPQGPVGCQGPKGDRGPRGERGPQGPQGLPGLNGRDGAPGPEGPRGCKGADGTVMFEELTEQQRLSLKGEKGDKGEQGLQGLRGPQGVPGSKGDMGLQGPQGPIGPNGIQGPKGSPGPEGPQGPPGPRGEQGPAGRDGFRHSDHIGESDSWNSKTIVDYSLHGKASWQWAEGPTLGVSDTLSGYVKDLKVYGKTMKNLVNGEGVITNPEKPLIQSPIISNKKNEESKESSQTQSVIYKRALDKPRLDINQDYTIIYKMTCTTSGYFIDEEVEKCVVYVKDSQGQTTVQEHGLKEGIMKISIRTPATEVQEIKINLFKSDDIHSENVNFKAENFMIVLGDYTQKVAPRFFMGEKGVGDVRKEEGSRDYDINIESRGKNLIDQSTNISDYYIEVDKSTPEIVYRYRKGLKGDSATFKVYCKQADYVLTLKAQKNMASHLRYFVVGYADDPTNGEPGTLLAHFEEFDIVSAGGYVSKHFKVSSSSINVLIIYVANLRYQGQSEQTVIQHRIKDVIEELQLEEGKIKTNYEEFKSITKAITIPQQLLANDYLEWDDLQGNYVIKTVAPGGEVVETTPCPKAKDEAFIHSFKDMTYLFIRTKIPTVIGAKFPIEANTSYYKNEWQFRGNDIELHEQNRNMLALPNGFVMQWREVSCTSGNVKEEIFLNATNIIFVIAGRGYSDVNDTVKNTVVTARVKEHHPNVVQYWASGNDGNCKAMLLVISDNRSFEDK